jgi:hypothetical protein
MASFASQVSITQTESFFSRFGRFGGNMSLLKSLLANDGQMEAWVQSLIPIDPVEHLTAFVSYQLPPFEELSGLRFDWVDDSFNGSVEWQEHESVKGLVDRMPGERTFVTKGFNKEMTSDQVIEWAKANGYRVAIHEEAVDFAKAHPDLQRKFWIVALGSSTPYTGNDDGVRLVAALELSSEQRYLDTRTFGREWSTDVRFLLVRK